MNFLNKIKLEEDLINQIKEINTEEIIDDLDVIEKEALGVYKLLIEKGIEDIKEILLYHIDILFRKKEDLDKLLTENVVKLINEDVNNIDIIDTL